MRAAKILLGVVATTIALVFLAPGIAYFAGLDNIVKLPEPAGPISLTEQKKLEIWQTWESDMPIAVSRENPWSYWYGTNSGKHLTWYVARHALAGNLYKQDTQSQMLSGVALIVWMTRHWTTEQLLAAAADIKASRSTDYSPLSSAH